MEDTWFSRDLPVLQAAVKISDESLNGPVRIEEVVRVTGLEEWPVQQAFQALEPFFENSGGTDQGGIHMLSRPTPLARERAGQWPTAEQMAQEIFQEIERRAESDPDPKIRNRFKKIAAEIASGGKDVGINLLAAVIAKSVGI